MEQSMRNFFLFLSQNKMLTKLAKHYGLRFGAARFVAGETIDGAVDVVRELNEQGLEVTVDHLGEFVTTEEEAAYMTEHCIQAIRRIHDEKLSSQLSLKLTSMGLDISTDLVMKNMEYILKEAKQYNVFVTIDMEDYQRCGKTITIFKELKKRYDNVGTVLQAYLYRTEQDIKNLSEYAPNLRLVKGAYKESTAVAFPDKIDVDDSFKNIIKVHLLNGHYTAIATHDDQIIEYAKKLAVIHDIPRDQFEFQMLFGIRPERQKQLRKEGYKMRVYVPYGKDWYGYFMRRLAERPANVAFILKGIVKK
ncbi:MULTISPECIES: proline dehydrogenase [Bacillaceae]|uniref:proline dehydrogenase family protein n=1 Tax=Bacillaceae TaxID=186817 RepID=UPI00104CD305|nr:proline dehydrogenase [Bacillus sp. CBEL-1]TDB51806.1 proline dehydrogenase [Bacillus sp. CBEL-1]